MIVMYTRRPTQRFTERINALMLHDDDWSYLAECVDAKNKCEALMSYLKDAAKRGTGISEDVVYFIMTGRDQYAFQQEAAPKKN